MGVAKPPWSTPTRQSSRRAGILGTFANYYRVVRDAGPADVTA